MLLLRILFVLAFCVATVGAMGFAKEIESGAWPLFGAGLAVTLATGWLLRKQVHAAAADAAAGELSLDALRTAVAAIRDAARALATAAPALDAAGLAQRLDEVIVECRMLGNRNEDFLRSLGTEKYVSVWDGFATGERLLARAWSMAADDYDDGAREELGKALTHLDRACAGHGPILPTPNPATL